MTHPYIVMLLSLSSFIINYIPSFINPIYSFCSFIIILILRESTMKVCPCIMTIKVHSSIHSCWVWLTILWIFEPLILFFSETVPVSGSYCHTCKLHASLLIRGQIPIPLRASSTPFVVPPSIQHTITKAGLISSAEHSNCLILVLWVSLWWNNSK